MPRGHHNATPRLAASNSFTAEEVHVLDMLMTAARTRGDVRQILRSPAALSVQRKVLAMKARVAEVREQRSAAAAPGVDTQLNGAAAADTSEAAQ